VRVRGGGAAVDALGELPAKARLAATGRPKNGDRGGPVSLGRRMEWSLREPYLPVPARERGLEPVDAPGTTDRGDDGPRREESNRLGFALELVHSHVVVGNGRCCGGPSGLVNPDLARPGDRLNARCPIDRVAGDHALPRPTARYRDLAGDDPHPHPQSGHADLVAEL